MDKGTFSNLVSLLLLVLGYFALPEGPPRTLVLSAALFALSGGLTNSIAVKMLFDRIPLLYGSGVIQTRFDEIRHEIRELVLSQFFNEEELRGYFRRSSKELDLLSFLKSKEGKSPITALVEQQWNRLADPAVLGPTIDRQVDKFLRESVGGLLAFVGADTVKGLVSKFVSGFVVTMREKVFETAAEIEKDPAQLGLELDEDRVIAKIEEQVSKLVDDRLARLTPAQVKAIVEDVIRRHMGWLVVWGNVFGGLLGLVAPFVSGSI